MQAIVLMNANNDDNSINAFQDHCPRVLVVDDEPHIVSFLLELLQDEGYETESATDGKDAVRKIRRHRPRVVISDVMMPKFSGNDLVRHLSATSGLDDPRVILMSAVVDRSPDPAVPLLQKPFDVDELLTLIGDAVSDGAPHSKAS